MRISRRLTAIVICLSASAPACLAQEEPPDRPPPPRKESRSAGSAVDGIVKRMMAFDKNGDGKLTRDEITDTRLLRVFDRADANKDGIVTKEELTALAAKMAEDEPENRDERRGPPDGPDGGPGRFGPPGGPPQPGQILPPFLQDRLNLTADQKQQLRELQKEVDGKLAKILTAEQKKQLKDLRAGFGRGGPGGRGPGGQGGQGGPGQGGPPPRE